jgi:hypothetical protein
LSRKTLVRLRQVALLAPHHHGSHRDLLSKPKVTCDNPARVDAIIVPTARQPASMKKAIELSRRLGCALVALCSGFYSSAGDVTKLALEAGVKVAAIDTDQIPASLLPDFKTTELLAGTRFERKTDTSFKRNVGLLLAYLAGWQRIIFLYDDIHVPNPDDLGLAARLLDSYTGVGLAIDGFPDNSVVCHAYRIAGGEQDTFIGGGALAVRCDNIASFFPNIYNEDWFFLLDEAGLRPSAMTGRVLQDPYDPFANDQRARSEEFGDTLAEGIFSLLDLGLKVQDADEIFWEKFLKDRQELIATVIAKVDKTDRDPAEKRRMISALKAARGRNHLITPRLCVEYLDALRNDQIQWQQHIRRLRPWLKTTRGLDPTNVLAKLAGEGFGSARRPRRARQPAA